MAGYIGSKASVVSNGAERKKVFDITATTTSLTGCSYTPNQVHVFHNGVRLVDGTDYTATDGSTVTLTTAAQSGDEVVVISYATFQTSDTVSASAGGTFSNAVTVDADGATVLTVDRATSDGTIIDLQKDGSSVGSIASRSGFSTSYIAYPASGSGSGISGTTNAILPTDEIGVAADNGINLGSSGVRWKDAYLSGGVYLGGTGAANYLDDYEEGTWVPSIGTGSITGAYGSYTKIGRLVKIIGRVTGFSDTSTATRVAVGNLPFISQSGSDYESTGSAFARYTAKSAQAAYIPNNQTNVYFYAMSGGDWSNQELDHADLQSSTADIYFSATYMTT